VATLPDGTRRVRGRVVVPADSGEAGVPGVWVTLHRVGRDTAGPIDSVRTDARGAYALGYRPRGDAGAVYFVATSRGGVAYFGSPLRAAVVEGEAAELVVYDTSSATGRVRARGQHLIVARPGPGGTREILEVFELANDTSVTFVPPMSGGVWSAALPAGATGFAVRETGELPADGLVALGGRATLMVPVAPGIRQVAYSYRLPSEAFPLRVPVAPGVGVLEVLVEDPGGGASGAALAPAGPVALEGKTFQRFLSQGAGDGGTVEVRVGEAQDGTWPRYAVPALLVGVGGAMAAGLLVAGRRKRQLGPAPHAGRPAAALAADGIAADAPADGARGDGTATTPAPDRDRLLAELAALDDAFDSGAASADERAAYAVQRATIKAQLAAELAGAEGGR
jgi:hypothetical protein